MIHFLKRQSIQLLRRACIYYHRCPKHLWASQVALEVKNLPANAGYIRDMDLIPGLGRSPGEGNDNPLQYSCLENSKDREAWRATAHRVAKRQTQLSD